MLVNFNLTAARHVVLSRQQNIICAIAKIIKKNICECMSVSGQCTVFSFGNWGGKHFVYAPYVPLI